MSKGYKAKKEGSESSKLIIPEYFSQGFDVYDDPKNIIQYEPRVAKVTDDTGKTIEEIKGAIFPRFWSNHAANTTASKYFRKEGIPETGREIDIRQLAGRVGRTIAEWGLSQGYVDKATAKILENEIVASTVFQYGAFNSPVWFNLGLDEYGINQEGENFYVDDNDKIVSVGNYYEHPQVAACFIKSPRDSIEDMINVGAVIAARIFKGGSGIGGDWSHVRSAGESVSGGGVASGAQRFMDVQDTCGRVIKSGGKTRRAATMQSIAVWHPDMPYILRNKYMQEQKAKILIAAGSPDNWESHTIQDLRGQNVNISIRTDDAFWEAYEQDKNYSIRSVKTGEIIKEMPARKLAEIMSFATHQCGDPGIQNHTIINRWNTCKNSGEIWASNPCSEYMFLDDSACNLASLNLMRFRQQDGGFDIESFSKAVDLYLTSQDILVSKASYPTKEIAWNSHIFRPLGLGYANLGAYIMSLGIPYDSEEARELAAVITTNMTAEAYLQSTRLAERLGAFSEFTKNKEPMLEIMEMHRKAAKKLPARNGLEKLVETATEKWDEVLKRGKEYGFRNAQVTLLAPTGTIGFMMDCDTTGCEPEFALKKYKELAGGGSMVIVNQTVPLALQKLGYDKENIEAIEKYINENGTVEGCSALKQEHIPVFDCAVSSGNGSRAIEPMGHIKMLGAIQPHLSGAMSKTINCPENTTDKQIEGMMYQGWKLGIKAIAIYRNGSKVSQPMKTKKNSKLEIITRGEREHLPDMRVGLTRKVKIGGIPLFLTTGEYANGHLGELFINSMERGSEVNRLLNVNAVQFSEKLQYGVPLEEALEIFKKAGESSISGLTNHPFIKIAKSPEGFIYDWISAHYLGKIEGVQKDPELRPLPQELRVYQHVPELHMIPTVAGMKMFEGVPSMEETIKAISGVNYWEDVENGLNTKGTIEKIKRERKWSSEGSGIILKQNGKITGQTCGKCGNLMISDGSCYKCPGCKISTGGCGGG